MTPADLAARILDAHLNITVDIIGSDMCEVCEQRVRDETGEGCRLYEDGKPCKWINENPTIKAPYIAPINEPK